MVLLQKQVDLYKEKDPQMTEEGYTQTGNYPCLALSQHICFVLMEDFQISKKTRQGVSPRQPSGKRFQKAKNHNLKSQSQERHP